MSSRVEDLNPGPPDDKPSSLTTQPCCLLLEPSILLVMASSVKIVFYKVPELKNLKSIFHNHSNIAELGFAGLLKAMLISDILPKL